LTYSQAHTGLVRAGYALKTHGKVDATSIVPATKPKTVDQVAGLALQVTIHSIPCGERAAVTTAHSRGKGLPEESFPSRWPDGLRSSDSSPC
jgi:hypothetical protein